MRWDDVEASFLKDHDAQTYQRPPVLPSQSVSNNLRTRSPVKTAELRYTDRANVPYSHPLDEISKNSRSVRER